MRHNRLKEIVDKAITTAEQETDLISEHAKSIPGMTSLKIKTFLNVIGMFADNYLEVGLYKGATFISAIEDNINLTAVGVDNWSQFGGPKKEFYTNFEGREIGATAHVYEMDAFSDAAFDVLSTYAPFDVMFYDGDHSAESQTKAVHLFHRLMSDDSLLIVDDWKKWGKLPTLAAVKDLGIKVNYRWELYTGWWEGVGVLWLSK